MVEDDGVEGFADGGRGQVLGGDARHVRREGVEQFADGGRAHEGAARALRLQRPGQGQRTHQVAAADGRAAIDDEEDSRSGHSRR
jgi:hypothetical protein